MSRSGAILGGAFALTISAALVQNVGTTQAVSFYLLIMTVIAFTAALLLRDRHGIPLDVEFEESGKYDLWEPVRRRQRQPVP